MKRLCLAVSAMWFVLVGCTTIVAPDIEDRLNTAVPDGRYTCCDNVEPLPLWLVNTMERDAAGVSRMLRSVALRDGFLLAHPDAHARVLEAAQPLDVMFLSMAHLLSGHTVSGYTHHVSIYLGSEDELRALGVWSHPSIRPLHDAIRAGAVVIEANGEQVRLAGPRYVFNADAVGLFTVPHLTQDQRRAGVIALAESLGTPFDYHFDLGTPDSVYCVELLAQVFPDLALPERDIYDRRVAIPDELAMAALNGENCLKFRGFVYGMPDRWGVGTSTLLAQSIARAWKTAPLLEDE